MKLFKINLMNIAKRLFGLEATFKTSEANTNKKINDINSAVESMKKITTSSDEGFSTFEKVATAVKKAQKDVRDLANKDIGSINDSLVKKADKTVVDKLNILATKNEHEIKTLTEDKVEKAEYKSLTAKVSQLENGSSNLEKTKVSKTELANYYNKTETASKIMSEIEKLVGSAPAALDTLKEVAEAMNNDPAFAKNLAVQIAGKVDKDEMKAIQSSINSTNGKIAKMDSQKFFTINQAGHGFIFTPVYYAPTGWKKATKNSPAEGMALAIDANNFYVFFDGIVTIPDTAKDDKNEILSNGEFYLLSKIGEGNSTKTEYENGVIQGLYKVVMDKGVKKALILIEQPVML